MKIHFFSSLYTHVSWKSFKRVKHVKSVIINDSSRHGVVSEIHFCASVDNKSRAFFSVSTFCLIVNAILNGRRMFQILFLVVPTWHFWQTLKNRNQRVSLKFKIRKSFLIYSGLLDREMTWNFEKMTGIFLS